MIPKLDGQILVESLTDKAIDSVIQARTVEAGASNEKRRNAHAGRSTLNLVGGGVQLGGLLHLFGSDPFDSFPRLLRDVGDAIEARNRADVRWGIAEKRSEHQ